MRWEHEIKVPEFETSVFIIPGDRVKNGEERVVVLNRVVKSVIESMRGLHPMYNTAWKSARERAAAKWKERHGEAAPDGFRKVPVHDLKHTYGRRLRAAGVSFEDRQYLLGHKSGRITTHYSQAELANLIAASEKAHDSESRKSPATSWPCLRTRQGRRPSIAVARSVRKT